MPFAEEGRAPQIPGPLLRVSQDAEIHVSIQNGLPMAAKIYGLHRHPGNAKDALTLAPGETREVRFPAGEPGTYLYWATTSNNPMQERAGAEKLLSGAFVVDAPGSQPHDRIFVINIWTEGTRGNGIEAINGKSWPFTERLTYKVGEATRFRVINTTAIDHAMHLHGFFFTVDGEGDGERYESYVPEQRRRAVTEPIDIGHVFEMSWTPERPGNWLFHCDMMAHMSAPEVPAPQEGQPAAYSPSSAHDHSLGMAGLVMGITVLGAATPAATVPLAVSARKLQLVISDNPGKVPLYALEVNDLTKGGRARREEAAGAAGTADCPDARRGH